MMYKTITLELIQDRPLLYERLRSTKRLLPAIDTYAIELKARHEEWTNLLSQERPERDSSQVASDALELALEELQNRLPCESATDDEEPLSLDAAMATIRRTSHA
jgi:hypothetical protein